MTKDIVSEIIYTHYLVLSNALQTNKEKLALVMSRKEIMELHAITILAYYYLTGEDLLKEDE